MKAAFSRSLFAAAALALSGCAAAAPAAPTVAPATATTAPPAVPTATTAPPVVPTATALPKPTEAPRPTAVPPTATVAPSKASKPLALVASMPIVKDLIDNLVAGIQGITVVSVVPLGSDPHEYEATPGDAKTIAGASAIIVVGAQYEDEWLLKLLKSAGGKPATIVAAEGITLKPIDKAFDAEFDNDPHIWMDPVRWQQAARNVAKGLAALDPVIAVAVNANAEAYVAKLKDGRVLMGILEKQDAGGIALRDLVGQKHSARTDDIESLDASPISLMPEGLLGGISDGDLRDLFAWLMKP